ncbi:MAG TPA: acetolactate decarboxylase [bacterium]|nr:acetolactate decarboxylase [bacterium]
MKYPSIRRFLLCLTFLVPAILPASAQRDNALTQISTIDAILNGLYDGVLSFGELREYGDFGIGTFHSLDGEMVALDGAFYQVKADGRVYDVTDTATTPFSSVTFFKAEKEIPIAPGKNYQQIQALLKETITAENIFQGIKIVGTFRYMKTRSVPGQTKPYPPLVKVTANQPTFEFHDIAGTVVGFYTPDYVGGLNVPGYHLHFLADDKSGGGHILDFTVREATLYLDYLPEIRVILPNNEDFNSLELSKDRSEELHQAEKSTGKKLERASR